VTPLFLFPSPSPPSLACSVCLHQDLRVLSHTQSRDFDGRGCAEKPPRRLGIFRTGVRWKRISTIRCFGIKLTLFEEVYVCRIHERVWEHHCKRRKNVLKKSLAFRIVEMFLAQHCNTSSLMRELAYFCLLESIGPRQESSAYAVPLGFQWPPCQA
jgi:hypothetical protein